MSMSEEPKPARQPQPRRPPYANPARTQHDTLSFPEQLLPVSHQAMLPTDHDAPQHSLRHLEPQISPSPREGASSHLARAVSSTTDRWITDIRWNSHPKAIRTITPVLRARPTRRRPATWPRSRVVPTSFGTLPHGSWQGGRGIGRTRTGRRLPCKKH
jgi:hypothetical protein